MVNIKAVIFDLDDTLIKTKQTKADALIYLAEHFYSFTLSKQKIHDTWGKPFEEFMQILFGEYDSVEGAIHNFRSITDQFPNDPYEGALDFVNQVAEHSVLGVVSSAEQFLVKHELSQTGFDLDMFEFIQGSDNSTSHKPNPDVFIPTKSQLQNHNIDPHQTVYIGDAITDFQAATGAGFHFIGISHHPDEQPFADLNTHWFTNFSDLSQFFFSESFE